MHLLPYPHKPPLTLLLGTYGLLDFPGSWVTLLSQIQGLGEMEVGSPGTSTHVVNHHKNEYHQEIAVRLSSTIWRHGRACRCPSVH